MLQIIILICYMLLLLWSLIVVFLFFSTFQSNWAGSPFIPSPKHITRMLPEFFNEMNEHSTFLEIGCGDGRNLCLLASHFPKTKMIGLEVSLLPFIIAKIKTRHHKNISIKYKNIFKANIKNITHIYAYLYPKLMDTLLPYLAKNTNDLTFVSCDFEFKNKKYEEELLIENVELGKKILVYKFKKEV